MTIDEKIIETAAKALYEVRPNGNITWESDEFDEWMERDAYIEKAEAVLASALPLLIPSEEELAIAIARRMEGWNEDTSEPDLDGPLRETAETHWQPVNEKCLKQARTYASALLELLPQP